MMSLIKKVINQFKEDYRKHAGKEPIDKSLPLGEFQDELRSLGYHIKE